MKKTLLLLLMITSLEGFSQIVAPQPSPSVTLNQTVGLSEVTLKYSRPAMRGRTVMGNLVPIMPFGEQAPMSTKHNCKYCF